jgi:hypothetical protein
MTRLGKSLSGLKELSQPLRRSRPPLKPTSVPSATVRDDHRGVEAWVCGLHFGGHEGAGGEELLGDEGDGVLDMVVGCGDCAWEVVGMYL